MKIFFAFLLAIAFIGLSSCKSTPPKKIAPVAAPIDAKKELSKAQIDFAAGSNKKALARLKALIAKHPKSDVSEDATVLMAKIYYKQKDYELAYRSYMSLVESDVFSPNEAAALLGA
jgi:outer membrane protein assembly factor BamD (BamD/ComL family)